MRGVLSTSPVGKKAPFRPIDFGPVDIAATTRADGSMLISSRHHLKACDASLARLFRDAVDRQPGRRFLAERRGECWSALSYEAARPQVDAIAQALLERGLCAERPVVILSGNSVAHGLLTLACYTAAVPVAPVSAAYSLQSREHAQLRHIAKLLTPGLIYVDDTRDFARALAVFDGSQAEIVAAHNGANLEGVTAFADLLRTRTGPALAAAVRSITPETIAKFLFTSGSTGFPKAVINTHGMLTSNQQALAQVWPFLSEQALVLVDWLPWNHTFGGNNNFNLILRQAGTLYIDGGRPLAGLIEHTVRNLAEISPTVYYNVPAGYAALLPFLERDCELARRFCAQLRVIFYAGAALAQNLWDRLEQLTVRLTGQRIPLTSAWGATETAPMATAAHFLIEQAGIIGVPVPGTTLKLVPNGTKLEARVKGPNVTPGYWRAPELTHKSFDEEGFYCIGDALDLVDPSDPGKGLRFDGRVAEDFKLTSGTWVQVGTLRVAAISAAAPVIADCVVAGEGRAEVALLVWLDPVACAELTGATGPKRLDEWARDPAIRQHVRSAFRRWNAEHSAGSQRIARVLLLAEPPSIDANEITDKGYINQRIALECRRAAVERLYAEPPDPEVIVLRATTGALAN